MVNKVWFITGASKGFGMELTKAALDRGDRVIATARNPKMIEDAFGERNRLLVLKLDVTNEQQVKEAVTAALKQFGQIDILALSLLLQRYRMIMQGYRVEYPERPFKVVDLQPTPARDEVLVRIPARPFKGLTARFRRIGRK